VSNNTINLGLHLKQPISASDFNHTWMFFTNIHKRFQYTISQKSMAAGVIPLDRS